MSGKLYVIPTPIGNIKDITLRAIEVINSLDLLVCEDTRVTGRLFHLLSDSGHISKLPKMISYNDHNAREKYMEVVDKIEEGNSVGLVSDAGTPTVSDPGFRVINECYKRDIEIEILPGASSVVQALVMASLGGEEFYYHGFMAKKSGKQNKEALLFKKLFEVNENVRIVIFVTPHRVVKDLNVLVEVLGKDVRGVLLREMTKLHEERIVGNLKDLYKKLSQRKLKGEMVLVIAKAKSDQT